jgi:hypothetical protein
MRSFLFLILGQFLMVSCETSPEIAPNSGLDYFPLRVGDYQIYSIEEIRIQNSIEQTVKFELKHKLIDSAINLEGGYSYTIQRQTRSNSSLPWQLIDLWTTHLSGRQAIVKEGNVSYVKLTFPAIDGLEWNGNSYNTLGGEQSCGENKEQACDVYKLSSFGKEFALPNGLAFAETLTVIQNENVDLIVKQDVRKEVYAKNIGLIHKESVILEYCTSSICLGEQKVDKGLRYKQTIKEYGSE